MNTSSALVIIRTFDAPIKHLWKAWSDPEMFKKWWGPKDFTCPVSKIDFRVGGKTLNCMHSPDEKDYWSIGTYLNIIPMEMIVVTDSFADENGNVVPSTHYGMEGFPLELEITVSFQKIEHNKTKMTLKHVGIPEGKIKEECTTGWNQSFDKLAKIVEE